MRTTKVQPRTKLLLATLSVATLLSTHAVAQDLITFSTPTGVTGDTSILNLGTEDLGVYFTTTGAGAGTETINGISLAESDGLNNAPSQTYTSGLYSISLAGGNATGTTAYSGFGSGAAPYSTLSAGLQTILKGGAYEYENGLGTVTLTGLTAGTAYKFELLVNDSRGGEAGRTETLSDTSATPKTSGTVAFNAQGAEGGVGDYVTGSFTSTGTTETFDINSTINDDQINAFELATAVPEPSTWALLGVSCVGLVIFLRRRSSILN